MNDKQIINQVIDVLKERNLIIDAGLPEEVQKRIKEAQQWTTPWSALSQYGTGNLTSVENWFVKKVLDYVFGYGNWSIEINEQTKEISYASNKRYIESIAAMGWLTYRGYKVTLTAGGHENHKLKGKESYVHSNGDMFKSLITSLSSKAYLNLGFSVDVTSNKRNHANKPVQSIANQVDELLEKSGYVMTDEIKALEEGAPIAPSVPKGKSSVKNLYKGLFPSEGTVIELFPIHEQSKGFWKVAAEATEQYPVKPKDDWSKSLAYTQKWTDASNKPKEELTKWDKTPKNKELIKFASGEYPQHDFVTDYLAYLRISQSFGYWKDFENASKSYLTHRRNEFAKGFTKIATKEVAEALMMLATCPYFGHKDMYTAGKTLGSEEQGGFGLNVNEFCKIYLKKYAPKPNQ